MVKERILIVDGDIELSSLLKSRLEAMGFMVDCARNGTEALEIIKSKWIGLIVMDIVLKGGINGFQLFKKVKNRKEFSHIPIIVQSTKVAMKKTFELMGAETFLIKPYSVDVLLEEVKDVLTKKILILGDKDNVTGSIARSLNRYDIKVDILHNMGKFYFNVISYRYCLVVLQYRMRPNVTDRILSIIRGSSKNREVPVIVYVAGKTTGLDEKELRKIQSLRGRCETLGACEFMDKGYTNKQFMELADKYLGSL